MFILFLLKEIVLSIFIFILLRMIINQFFLIILLLFEKKKRINFYFNEGFFSPKLLQKIMNLNNGNLRKYRETARGYHRRNSVLSSNFAKFSSNLAMYRKIWGPKLLAKSYAIMARLLTNRYLDHFWKGFQPFLPLFKLEYLGKLC